METLASETQTADLPHCDLIQQVIVETIESACEVHIRPYKFKDNDDSEQAMAIVISLAGDIQWATFIALPASTACKTAEKFAGFEIPFESEDMDDALGEFATVFAEKVKSNLAGQDITAVLSLPKSLRIQTVHAMVRQARVSELKCYKSSLGKVWAGVISTN